MEKILCLDFDGVLNSYVSGWTGDVRSIPDPMVAGGIEFLIEAVKVFDVQIYSSRSGNPLGIEAMWHYIYGHALQHYRNIPENTDFDAAVSAKALMNKIKFPTQKPPLWVGLDDRQLNFDGTWPSMESLLNFKPWYQK